MSVTYNVVREYYTNGRWSVRRVRHAVQSGWITPEEFKDITGQEYQYLPEEDDNAVGGAGLIAIGAALESID